MAQKCMTMVERLWEEMSDEPLAKNYEIRTIGPPAPTDETMSKCRELCGQNLCGTFNANWGCPPGVGSEKECLSLVKRYFDAAVIMRRYDGIDLKDKTITDRIVKDHQELCRRFGNVLRKNGYDVLPLADGGCTYCGTCSYPDSPCRFPDQRITSVSCYGILMDEYMGSQGVDFTFEKESMTLYGIMLYNTPAGK